MLIFPAIDIFNGKAVRLYKGDYNKMTVYSDNPCDIAVDFSSSGASCLHLVDLEGAKSGETPNLETIKGIVSKTDLYTEVGGGIRSLETIRKYLDIGVMRVILGTAAVNDPLFLDEALKKYSEQIAIGVDIRDGQVAIKGWTESSGYKAEDFCRLMQSKGVKTIICTDISRDGAMQGSNNALYNNLAALLDLNLIASGGISSLADIKALNEIGMHGAIIGKAYYNGSISIKEAIEVAR